MNLSENAVPVRNDDDVAVADFEDEAVLWHVPSNRVHRLNSTAVLIWRLCDGSGSVSQLIDDVASVYDASRAQLAADIVAILDEFVADGLVTTI